MFALAAVLVLTSTPAVQLGTGAKMCEALSAADFKAMGLSPDPSPPRPPNSTEAVSAYCTYTKLWVREGGLELDIFGDPAAPDSEARATVETILGDAGARLSPAGYPSVDESLISLDTPGDPKA